LNVKIDNRAREVLFQQYFARRSDQFFQNMVIGRFGEATRCDWDVIWLSVLCRDL